MKKPNSPKPLDLSIIAQDFVEAHDRHSEALETSSLAYLDKVMDALLARPQRTVREVVTDLLDIVPALSEREAFGLASVKFLGIGLDAEGRVRQCGVNSVVASGRHFQAALGVICSG